MTERIIIHVYLHKENDIQHASVELTGGGDKLKAKLDSGLASRILEMCLADVVEATDMDPKW